MVCGAARDNRIEVVGTFYERSPRDNRVYDTSFLADGSGAIRSTYRKIHLYDALGFRESDKAGTGRLHICTCSVGRRNDRHDDLL